jgi:hypothetical protein
VTSAEVSAGSEAELISRLFAVLDRVSDKTTELQTALTGKIHLLPAGVRDAVVAGWNDFCATVRKMWDFWYDLVTHLGSPTRVSAAAREWSELVGGPVSTQVQSADAGLLTVDTTWNGSAADAYRETLPRQKVALDAVKTSLADGISTALTTVVQAMVVFWGCLLGALAALVAGLIGAISSAATILGLPASPLIAAAAVATACLAVIVGGANLESMCTSASVTLRQRLDAQAAFHNGHWPPATTE